MLKKMSFRKKNKKDSSKVNDETSQGNNHDFEKRGKDYAKTQNKRVSWDDSIEFEDEQSSIRHKNIGKNEIGVSKRNIKSHEGKKKIIEKDVIEEEPDGFDLSQDEQQGKINVQQISSTDNSVFKKEKKRRDSISSTTSKTSLFTKLFARRSTRKKTKVKNQNQTKNNVIIMKDNNKTDIVSKDENDNTKTTTTTTTTTSIRNKMILPPEPKFKPRYNEIRLKLAENIEFKKLYGFEALDKIRFKSEKHNMDDKTFINKTTALDKRQRYALSRSSAIEENYEQDSKPSNMSISENTTRLSRMTDLENSTRLPRIPVQQLSTASERRQRFSQSKQHEINQQNSGYSLEVLETPHMSQVMGYFDEICLPEYAKKVTSILNKRYELEEDMIRVCRHDGVVLVEGSNDSRIHKYVGGLHVLGVNNNTYNYNEYDKNVLDNYKDYEEERMKTRIKELMDNNN